MSDSIVVTLPDQDPMLRAIGRGIQQFAVVEHGLSILFADLMEPAGRNLSVLAIDAVGRLEAKMQVVKAVADEKFKKVEGDVEAVADRKAKLAARVRNVLNRISNRGDTRNKLAHWTASHWPAITDSTPETWKNLSVVLVPPMHSRFWGPVMWDPKNSKTKPITLRQLEEFSDGCNKLFGDIVDLSADLKAGTNRPNQTGDIHV